MVQYKEMFSGEYPYSEIVNLTDTGYIAVFSQKGNITDIFKFSEEEFWDHVISISGKALCFEEDQGRLITDTQVI